MERRRLVDGVVADVAGSRIWSIVLPVYEPTGMRADAARADAERVRRRALDDERVRALREARVVAEQDAVARRAGDGDVIDEERLLRRLRVSPWKIERAGDVERRCCPGRRRRRSSCTRSARSSRTSWMCRERLGGVLRADVDALRRRAFGDRACPRRGSVIDAPPAMRTSAHGSMVTGL